MAGQMLRNLRDEIAAQGKRIEALERRIEKLEPPPPGATATATGSGTKTGQQILAGRHK